VNALKTPQKKDSLELHEKLKGKLQVKAKPGAKLSGKNLPLLYTPGVSFPCTEIAKRREKVFSLTGKQNSIAVITDGTAVLGLGKIGAEASLPVMEGKALLFSELAGINAFPLVLDTRSPQETVQAIKAIAPSFGGINLEDIASPYCFYIEEKLQGLGIPVVHDDQHATAIVALAGLINAFNLADKEFRDAKIVLSGCGAAGTAIAKLLHSSKKFTPRQMLVFDKFGSVRKGKKMPEHMREVAALTGSKFHGSMKEALHGADAFIGVSAPNLLSAANIKKMVEKPVVFAMANPVPEISFESAKRGGAFIVGTGRSDYPNQINNVLVFPGMFRGLLDAHAKRLSEVAKLATAKALASSLQPSPEKILPGALDSGYVKKIARSVKKASRRTGKFSKRCFF